MKTFELTTQHQVYNQIVYGDEGQIQDNFNMIASAINISYNQYASEEHIREALFEALETLG